VQGTAHWRISPTSRSRKKLLALGNGLREKTRLRFGEFIGCSGYPKCK